MSRNFSRRRLSGVVVPLGVIVFLALVATVAAGRPPAVTASGGWPAITLQPVTSGVTDPIYVTHAGDGSGRLFIVEKGGRIRIFSGGTLLPTPFLDVGSLVSTGSEQGLLGLAFPPDYSSTGRFYIYYTDTAGDTVVARYRVSANPNIADPASAVTILAVEQDFSNHNGGMLAFGPDGRLYIGLGDGGSSGDPLERAQALSSLLGKILRVDVSSGGPVGYAIPPDNPFVGTAGARGEIWALGLRNPWRFAFDRLTAELFIADVGQNAWEEINLQPASSVGGENYGWDCYEGNHLFESAGCAGASTYVFPIHEYAHGPACSITGGFVSRGPAASLDGIYFYGDYCTGDIHGLRRAGAGWESARLDSSLADFSLTSFGEDEAGNIYVADKAADRVLRIVPRVTPTPTATARLTPRFRLPIVTR